MSQASQLLDFGGSNYNMSDTDVTTKTEVVQSTQKKSANHYYRQLPLFAEVKEKQLGCIHAKIEQLNFVLICSDCGSVWIR